MIRSLPSVFRFATPGLRTFAIVATASVCLAGPGTAAEHINETESLLEAFGGQVKPPFDQGPSRQFDFWIGAWEANWRAAVEGRLENADSTETTDAWIFPVLHGKALVELARGQTVQDGSRTQGFSIRYFDPARQRWVMAQNWAGPDKSYAYLDQLQGGMRHGRVQLYSSWTDDAGLVTRRYTFSDIHPARLRWDSAETRDSGDTWRPGQITEFRRKVEGLTLPKVGQPLPDWFDGSHCTERPFHRFDWLEGDWRGEATNERGESWPARLVAARFQNGCGVLSVLSWGGRQILQAITYRPSVGVWFTYHLDNRPGTTHQYRLSTEDTADLVFVHHPELAIRGELEPFSLPDPLLPAPGRATTSWERPGEGLVTLLFEEQEGPHETRLRVELSRRAADRRP